MLRVAFFDLDDTLYPASSGLWDALGDRIVRYMIERVGLPPAEVPALREQYFRTYGTTLNGLRTRHGVAPDDYLAFVHDLPLEQYLQPSPALDGMLARLPLRKFVFTNADAPHAARVLARLGVQRRFEGIIDIHALQFVNKPDPGAYAAALRLAGAPAAECLFVDDAPRNLLPAHASGMLTVLVDDRQAHAAPPEGADFVVRDVLGLERIVAGRVGQTG
jgi:putative hydrolase of the HAD superfamily